MRVLVHSTVTGFAYLLLNVVELGMLCSYGIPLPGATAISLVVSGAAVVACIWLFFGFGSLDPRRRESYAFRLLLISLAATIMHQLVLVSLHKPLCCHL